MRRYALLLAGLSLAGCEDALFFDPAVGGPASVHVQVDAAQLAGSPADAFDQADRVGVTLVAPESGERAYQEETAFSPAGAETRIVVELDLQGDAVTFDLAVVLSRGSDPLFVGRRSVVLEAGRTTEAPVSLTAIPTDVAGPASLPDFTTYGDVTPLGAAVVMATGDTIPGLGVVWTSENPQVVAVQEGAGANPRAQAIADGTTEVVARFTGEIAGAPVVLEHRVPVTVRAEVTRVEVDPASVVLELSETATLSATGFDANGNPVSGRPVAWRSLDELVATVDEGVVTPVEPGTTQVVATMDGVDGSAEVMVEEPDPPPPPGNPTVSYVGGVRFAWVDASGGTAEYEVQRAVTPPPSAPARAPEEAFVTVAVLPPGSQGYTDPAPVPGFLEYRVRACNAFECSAFTTPVGFPYHLAPGAITDPPGIFVDAVVEFRGRVNPNGLPTQYYFEWDFSPFFTEPARTNGIPAGDGFVDVSAAIIDSGLPSGVTLYVRLVAENSAGTTVANVLSFTIPAGAPPSPGSSGGVR